VSNTPGAVDDGTATTALYLIISSLRQFARAEKNLAGGDWKRGLTPAHDPSSRTLGILGFGGIGLRTAELTRGFPMRVVYHSRKRAVNEPEWAKYYADFKEFLEATDILSIHVPLNNETCGLVGEREIRTLRKGSVIINTARGKILDEDALIRALGDGHVSYDKDHYSL
jgi:glyoxylate reductase